jgi:hypothetical protein
VRLLNPTDTPIEARLRPGFPIRTVRPLRLDETPSDEAISIDDGTVRFDVPPHRLRSVRLEPQ